MMQAISGIGLSSMSELPHLDVIGNLLTMLFHCDAAAGNESAPEHGRPTAESATAAAAAASARGASGGHRLERLPGAPLPAGESVVRPCQISPAAFRQHLQQPAL